TDQDTGLPLGGVTVIVAGPQGEDAVITSDRGEYSFTTLPVGTYIIRFYAANTSTQVEQPGVIVAAEETVRVNAKISSAAVNTVLKSGTNELHGSAFGYWSPYWLAANPTIVQPVGSSLTGVRKLDFDDSIGVEVGGPIVKDKLFFWLGFAPRITDTHVLRLT